MTNNDRLHQLHYSCKDLNDQIHELRKQLGEITNPFIRIHNETNRSFIRGRKVTDEDIYSWEASYKGGIAKAFQLVASFSEALQTYEKYENSYKTGMQFEIQFDNNRLSGVKEEIAGLLNVSEKEIVPHISGRAARKKAV